MLEAIERRRGEPWFEDAAQAIEEEQSGAFSSVDELIANLQRQIPLYFHRWAWQRAGRRPAAQDFAHAEPLHQFNTVEFPTFDLRAELRTVEAPAIVWWETTTSSAGRPAPRRSSARWPTRGSSRSRTPGTSSTSSSPRRSDAASPSSCCERSSGRRSARGPRRDPADAQTNMAVYAAVMEPGDTLMALALNQGGHLTHGHKVNFSGRLYNVAHYEVSRATMTVDYDEVLAKAKEARPKVLVCGGSAYPRTVDTERFRAIADEVGALLLCDMAHFAGLVAAGLQPNPVEHCDFVTSTTHKTLAGPRAGFILCREEHAKALDSAVMPGMQGGPLEHTIAAKATCFRIAMTDAFREYQAQVRRNADALGETLLEGGLSLVTGGTDTHLLLVDLSAGEWTGKAAEERLHEIDVTVNRNTIPFDERSPFVTSGIRLGSPAMTMRGLDEDDFREVGRIICEALTDSPDLDGLRGRVAALCAKRPLYEGFRGYTTYVA